MASRTGGGVAWLHRLWRRMREQPLPHPAGPRRVLPVTEALGLLEAQVCEGFVRVRAPYPGAAFTSRDELPGPIPRNAFGRGVHEELVADPAGAVARATGMAMSGLRAAVFLRGDELIPAHDALRSAASRMVPMVVHANLTGTGHGPYHQISGAGGFQILASSGQEALDWALLARWLAERTLVPGLVAIDTDAVETMELVDEECLRTYLGAPDEAIAAPSEAQRLLFGLERPRLLRWFDPDRPVATQEIRDVDDEARGAFARRLFYWDPLQKLALEGMQELQRCTGRSLAFVQPYRMDDADLVLVGQGAGVQAARAVADHLRARQRFKVGVLGIPWLRPFPTSEVVRALEGRRDVAVVEPGVGSPADVAPLFGALTWSGLRADGWVSATCAGMGPDPAALVRLCERMRQPKRPVRIHLEPTASPGTTGFPRRDAAIQALASVYPELVDTDPTEARPPEADAHGGRSVGVVGRESELPLDALARLAELLADEVGEIVRGSVIRREPGAWEARVRAASADFPDPGPRAPVSLLLVAGADLRRLGNPLASLASEGTVLVSSGQAPEQVWASLPAAWRGAVEARDLRLYVAGEGFEAGLEAIRACLGEGLREAVESGALREVAWRELPCGEAAERALPRLASRLSRARPAHDSLPRFWGEVVQPREGGDRDAWPDPLTATGVVPALASALAPDPETPLLPVLDPEACTGCGRCWSSCPDSAIGVTALPTESLWTAASRIARTEGRAADALRRAHRHLAGRLAGELAKRDSRRVDPELCREVWAWLEGRLGLSDQERPEYQAAFESTLAVIDRLQPIVTGALFREPEEETRGSGDLLVLAIDPRSCLGCKLCIATCPEDALRAEERTPDGVDRQRDRWRLWEELPDTGGETLARAAAHAELGPLASTLLSRHAAQGQVGGSGGEPGSGERLGARLVAAVVEQHGQRRMTAFLKDLEQQRAALEQAVRERLGEAFSAADLETLDQALSGVPRGHASVAELGARLDDLGSRATFDRRAVLRMTRLAAELDRQRRRLLEGEDGLGRARFGVVVARGTVAEWAARFPAHPYYAPLTLATTAESVELAWGLTRGLAEQHLELLRALRRAALEVEAPHDRPARLEAIAALGWTDLDATERAACPPLLLLGDDTALLGEGFEAVGRLLDADLPVKVVILDARGQLVPRPEPALVAMAHRRAFVLAGSVAHPDHLARGLGAALAWPGPALIHLHAPSPRRHGFPPETTLERARLAVEARAHVLLCYDPSAEGVFGLRASLEGNPGLDQDWGEVSFADWAAGESRFAPHFAPVEDGVGIALEEWLRQAESARRTQPPVVETPAGRLAVSDPVARAAAERLGIWNTLREVAGLASPFTETIRAALDQELRAQHQAEIDALKSESQARLAEAQAGADREALGRLTERLMTLSGFDPEPSRKRNGA